MVSRCNATNPEAQLSALAAIVLAVFISSSTAALELSRSLIDYIDDRFGSDASQRLLDWQEIANSDTSIDTKDKLMKVNAFFNRAEFISDQVHWGSEDYWATPVELLATNGGDCEDYSIAKYFTLKEMGVPEERLKITYVKALKLNQAHMVLAYYDNPDADPLILDNLTSEIQPASIRKDLQPVYSFNGEGLWLSRFKGRKQKRIGGPDKLNNWLDMMGRQKKLIK